MLVLESRPLSTTSRLPHSEKKPIRFWCSAVRLPSVEVNPERPQFSSLGRMSCSSGLMLWSTSFPFQAPYCWKYAEESGGFVWRSDTYRHWRRSSASVCVPNSSFNSGLQWPPPYAPQYLLLRTVCTVARVGCVNKSGTWTFCSCRKCRDVCFSGATVGPFLQPCYDGKRKKRKKNRPGDMFTSSSLIDVIYMWFNPHNFWWSGS